MSAAAPGEHALFSVAPAFGVVLLALLVIAEAILLPAMVLPGGTGVALAGALAGAGRAPTAAVALSMAVAVLAGDHGAYTVGGRLIRWWRGRRGNDPGRPAATGRLPAAATGRWRHWALAALPSVAGAQDQPYRRFLPRLLVLRTLWFAAFFTAGILAAHSLGTVERVGGPVAAVLSALVIAALLAAHHRLRWPWLATRNSLSVAGLIVLAVAAGWAAGGVVQDAVTHEELARFDPQVASLLARHIPVRVARAAVAGARLVNPPGVWVSAGLAITLAHLLQRGHSTARFLSAAAGAALLAGGTDLLLQGGASDSPVQLGMAVLAALWLTWALFAWQQLPRPAAAAGTAAASVALTGLAAASLTTSTPTTAVLAGTGIGLAWSALLEALVRIRALPVARLLSDQPDHGVPPGHPAGSAPERHTPAMTPAHNRAPQDETRDYPAP